jgi:regulator of replication initiation timing
VSELRDMAAALSTLSKSLSSIEEHLAKQVANGEQLRIGMHDLRGEVQKVLLDRSANEIAVKQIQTWMGDFSRKQLEISEGLAGMQTNLQEHRREINKRIRDIEPQEEVTQA